MPHQNHNATFSRTQFAKHWSVKGFTATLIIIAALLPVVSALSINFWLDGYLDWNEATLELGVACMTLAFIAYPAFYLLRWETEQATRWDETRQDFLLLMDQAVDMVIVSTPQGLIKEVNQKACDRLQYTRAELLSMSTLDLDIDCHLQRSPELVKSMLSGEDVYYETIFRLKNGKKIPIESRARMAGWLEQPHYIEFISDISHRREAEKELHLSHEALEKTRNLLELRIAQHSSEIKKQKKGRKIAEKQFDALQNYLARLIDSMPSVIIALDNENCILQWNKEAENMTGIGPEEAVGSTLGELYPLLDHKIIQAKSTSDLLTQSINFRMEQEVNLSLRTLEVMVYGIYNTREENMGEVVRIDDITEKVKIDATLVQTEKMLSLGGLAAGMAHEINNPLGAIMQSTQNIKRRLSSDLLRNHKVASENNLTIEQVSSYVQQQSIDTFLDGILASGERAADIVGDMLSFAKPIAHQSGHVDLTVALDTAVRLSAKDYNQKKQFDFRKIQIRKTYAPNVGKVFAQKNQLEQVFLNLLVNAAQALASQADKNKEPLIELILRREGKTAVVEVIDNGPGMPEKVRKRVFEPFFTTKDENTGTGLGLSVSYFIISEQLGGELRVESQSGRGSRFTIRLPSIDNSATTQGPQDEQIELPL
ncbi:MAG: PAS domain S-box protein [Kangiellaceae bacterium]|nr:PAS domain S-box protein [Kangiellaceae bacterium]